MPARTSRLWTLAAAAIGAAVAVAGWTSGPIGGHGAEAAEARAVAAVQTLDPLCRSVLSRYAHEGARAEAAFPLPSAFFFAAARDKAGETYVGLGCPTGKLLAAMAEVKANWRAP